LEFIRQKQPFVWISDTIPKHMDMTWMFGLKWDGIRVAVCNGKGYTRGGMALDLAALPWYPTNADYTFDAELCLRNGRSSHDETMRRVHSGRLDGLRLRIFDVRPPPVHMVCPGHMVAGMSFRQRQVLLDDLHIPRSYRVAHRPLQSVAANQDEFWTYVDSLLSTHEGVVVRNPDAEYHCIRSNRIAFKVTAVNRLDWELDKVNLV
jgi:ATP-dependent DNA ligase